MNKNINISDDFDPLQYAIKLGHTLNLEIHVWMNCYILWSGTSNPLDKKHILYIKPLWTESDIYGKLDAEVKENHWIGYKDISSGGKTIYYSKYKEIDGTYETLDISTEELIDLTIGEDVVQADN